MILHKIYLHHFRNVTKQQFAIHPFLTVIIGENAQGKTNLLESIYFSVHGEGFRESKEEELLQWEQSNALVETGWQQGDEKFLFQITLQDRGASIEKKFFVNKSHKTHKQYQDYQTNAVLFAPEHIEIVSGSPDKRRDYFNKLISLFDVNYKTKLTNYEHALRKRNKVLEHHHDIQTLQEELAFWNEYLEQQATYISKKREEYIHYLNEHQHIDHRKFSINYAKNELTQEKLQQVFDEERKWRRTIIGPQKDDFEISLEEDKTKENVHHFGSRSEQRLAVFWLKLNEIRYFEEQLQKRPILLLDDVFSELDVKNKRLVLDLVKQYQTVLTTTEVELLEIADMPKTTLHIGSKEAKMA